MYPTIRQSLADDGPNVASTVTTSSACKAGDVLVALVSNDWGGIADVATPVATGVTWTQWWMGNNTVGNGLHAKVFTGVLDVDGAKTITVAVGANVDNVLAVVVIDGATVDPTWLDTVTATQSLQASSASHVIPATSTTTTQSLWLGWATTNASGPATYTAPTGTAELLEKKLAHLHHGRDVRRDRLHPRFGSGADGYRVGSR